MLERREDERRPVARVKRAQERGELRRVERHPIRPGRDAHLRGVDAPADEGRVDARTVRADDVVRHRVAHGQHAAGRRAPPERFLVDVGVRLAHGVCPPPEFRDVARHEAARHRRRTAVGPHEVRVCHDERQALRRGRLQQVVAHVVPVPGERPAGQRHEEAPREHAVGRVHGRGRHAGRR